MGEHTSTTVVMSHLLLVTLFAAMRSQPSLSKSRLEQFETWEDLKTKLAPGGRICCNVGGFASAERAINAMRAAFGSGNTAQAVHRCLSNHAGIWATLCCASSQNLALHAWPCEAVRDGCAGNVMVRNTATERMTANMLCMSGPFAVPGWTFQSHLGQTPPQLAPYTEGWAPII